jgi:pyroglutamyl-peptidase
MQPVVLLAGFEPFGGAKINPSEALVHALNETTIADHRLVGVSLPCEFGRSMAVLGQAIDRWRPALVMALGQAAGRADLSIERVAINVADANIADNAGASPIDVPVVAGGPAAHFSTLPIKAIVAALRAGGIPASVSQSAGTYVCNDLFYGLQHRLAGSGTRSGFIHLPLLPEQVAADSAEPCLPLQTMLAGVRIAVATALDWERDLRAPGGAVA